jgi:hypothetical protein
VRLSRLFFTLTDDRGQRHDTRAHPATPGWTTTLVRRGLFWTVFMTLGAVGYAAATRAAGRPLLHASNAATLLGSCAIYLVGLASLLPAVVAERRRHARALSTQGRCGACGYDLAHTRAADDNCRVCPECGAAWRMRLP